jgi:transcriptional regulator with XRE-family HTH domain
MAGKHIVEQKAIDLLGYNVRKYRNNAKISQALLAELVGVDYSQIARIELGKINTSVSMIYLIAEALNIEPELLLRR